MADSSNIQPITPAPAQFQVPLRQQRPDEPELSAAAPAVGAPSEAPLAPGNTPLRPLMGTPIPIRSLDEARAFARERFKERLSQGEPVGNCNCHSSDAPAPLKPSDGQPVRVTGVRFRDSGQLYYFDAGASDVEPGDWVVVDSTRGEEAARVVLAPHQIGLNQLEGELRPVLRKLSQDDIERMESFKRAASTAVKTFGEKIREYGLPMKPISASYTFDGSSLTLNYSLHQNAERPDLRELGRDLAREFHCRVELKQVGPRDEARLLGGLGRCGRTLCCSSWLPMFPEISMNMAKTQDLALNPSKVSGVCGRLLCCLSYENEQYKQVKAILPRLGQIIETPEGRGQVMSMQVLQERVTVRLLDAEEPTEKVFTAEELGLQRARTAPDLPADSSPLESGEGASRKRRRRRRNRVTPESSSAPPTTGI